MIFFLHFLSRPYTTRRVDPRRRSRPPQPPEIRPQRTELRSHPRHSHRVDDDALALAGSTAALDEGPRGPHHGSEAVVGGATGAEAATGERVAELLRIGRRSRSGLADETNKSTVVGGGRSGPAATARELPQHQSRPQNCRRRHKDRLHGDAGEGTRLPRRAL